ncbi:metal ABC transporter solute-binding protein, Zn/Mn family [Ornithinibacillus scapharcae]|uniref:metal ABC transporter solute-binding protein, Zn/Mn family n=1 Tax=Ornithinibacillus scapharcae TaxID=1147159 RepID=UPI000225B5CD|nr:zinc ABC transporter substrate-binding protein [Ornithinibacillus scapharcae]
MRIIRIFTTIIFSSLLFGCQNVENARPDEKLTIYTSVYPIQYIVERIGGNTLSVYSIFPPGVDAHSYEPTTKMMTSLAKSDAFFYIGAGMEGFSEAIANALKIENVKLLELGLYEELYEPVHLHEQGETLKLENHHDDGHNHGEHDPHIWIDPLRMIDMAHIIVEQLMEINPSQAALYERNFKLLIEDFAELDKLFSETLANKKQSKILVSHAAFGYWEERYGIEQVSINGISSTLQPSQKDLIKIIKQAEKSDFNYVIFEQNTFNKVSTIIQEYIDVDSLTIHNLAVLTEEDLNRNEDYLTLMKKTYTY